MLLSTWCSPASVLLRQGCWFHSGTTLSWQTRDSCVEEGGVLWGILVVSNLNIVRVSTKITKISNGFVRIKNISVILHSVDATWPWRLLWQRNIHTVSAISQLEFTCTNTIIDIVHINTGLWSQHHCGPNLTEYLATLKWHWLNYSSCTCTEDLSFPHLHTWNPVLS